MYIHCWLAYLLCEPSVVQGDKNLAFSAFDISNKTAFSKGHIEICRRNH